MYESFLNSKPTYSELRHKFGTSNLTGEFDTSQGTNFQMLITFQVEISIGLKDSYLIYQVFINPSLTVLVSIAV